MKTAVLACLLILASGFDAAGVDPQPTAAQLEQRWQSLQPELFVGDAGKKHLGTSVRFRAGVSTQNVVGVFVVIRSKEGDTIQISNVSKAARRDVATPHIPLTTATFEDTITWIDPARRIVSIKASKVDVTW